MERFKTISAPHMIVCKNNKILLLRRKNTGYEDGNYSVPAGHHDQGECMLSTAIRELEEETTLKTSKDDLLLGTVMHRIKPDGTESIDFFFIVNNWNNEPVIAEPDYCDDLTFFEFDHLPVNIIPYVKYGIQQSMLGNHYCSYGWK